MEDAEISELYSELRKIASFHIRKSVNHPTLHPTMLVHEAWMRIDGAAFKSKTHYLAVASRAMRNVVVDYIRAKTANRRGGDWRKVTLEGASAEAAGALAFRLDEVLDLDAALDELARQDERKARVVEMRFFGGMEFEEVAEILAVSVVTVKRDWAFAKAWLGARLKP